MLRPVDGEHQLFVADLRTGATVPVLVRQDGKLLRECEWASEERIVCSWMVFYRKPPHRRHRPRGKLHGHAAFAELVFFLRPEGRRWNDDGRNRPGCLGRHRGVRCRQRLLGQVVRESRCQHRRHSSPTPCLPINPPIWLDHIKLVFRDPGKPRLAHTAPCTESYGKPRLVFDCLGTTHTPLERPSLAKERTGRRPTSDLRCRCPAVQAPWRGSRRCAGTAAAGRPGRRCPAPGSFRRSA